MTRPQGTESADGALGTHGLEESCAQPQGYRVWAQEWATKKVKGNIQFPQRSVVYVVPELGPPLGVTMGVNLIKALGPLKSALSVNLSLLAVVDSGPVEEVLPVAWENYWILWHWGCHCSGKFCLLLDFE